MMRHDGPSSLANNGRMSHFLGIANVDDVINHVSGVFMQGIVHRAVRRRPRSIVIDSQAAAYVDELHRMTHLRELRIKARSLPDGPLDYADISDLRSDMEMHQH